ncbi:MAG: tetratricopeptide repeat protein [Porticoccaceae bacterium]|nr:tetratricopeptide repeat protein [Porticoccaceae bacterium]
MRPSSRAINYRPPQSIDLVITMFLCMFAIALSAESAAQTITTEIPESDPISDYLEAIETAEAETSAYSAELSDLYFGLGKSHFSKREYESARRAYQRGMQIERVNYGLNSLSQTPYLLSIADTESFLGNWEESQDALENVYSINSQAYGETDPRMLPVLDELLDWYMDTYKERTRDGGYQNLVMSERLGNRISKILKTHVPIDDPDAVLRYRKIGHLHYFIAKHIKEYGEPSDSGFTINSGATTSSPRSTSHLHYQRGKTALKKVIESLDQQPNSSASDKAKAIAELGDWYLAFGQRMSATKTYKLAFQTLAESDESPQLSKALFDQPSVIKFTAIEGRQERIEPQEKNLQVSMTVTKTGVPIKMEILNPPENITKSEIRSILKDIRSKRFRPRLVDGITTESKFVLPYSSKKTQG